MDWELQGHHSPTVAGMVQKPSLSFLGRRSWAPRPLSEATEIFDTDSEDDMTPRSLESMDDDSQTSVSSQDELKTPKTPLTGGLGGFEFHFDDKPVEGPVGPHLFRASPDSFQQEQQDFLLAMSPITALRTSRHQSSQPRSSGSAKAPCRPFESLNVAVAELDETQVRDWTPQHVADWMSEAGFDQSVVEKFLIHDISGNVLLDLQFEDLKELDISSFGKRHRVMSSIQHLRNSSMISLETPLSRTPSRTTRSPRALQRPPKPEESRVVTESPSRSRRGRHHRKDANEAITPAESVSIVAIEQLLPKPHNCSKGEDCSKWKKQQKKLQRLQEEFAEDFLRPASEAVPSVVASSDVLGPDPVNITPERLNGIQPRDPQENVRQFLNFQHMHAPSTACNPSPPPAASALFAAKTAHHAENLQGLPKLTIPNVDSQQDSAYPTPISALGDPGQLQAQQKLQRDPYHYGGVASPVDVYRVGTPFSATDIPVTVMPVDPCQRDASQSVPPDMRYGAFTSTSTADPIRRCNSTQPAPRRHPRQTSFTPAIAPVRENSSIMTSEADLANHSGWMRRRKTTRLLRHEWSDNYFALEGSKLAMLTNDTAEAKALEYIDVDEYILHAYSAASSSKLSAAFKKGILGSGKSPTSEPTFAFSLVPENDRTKKLFEKSKSHHFAVRSGKDRVEWMRKLMLAKALKKNDACQI